MREHTGAEVSDYKFTDQELDNESNLYNYDARLYDPVIGRFISADPYLSPQLGNKSNSRFRLSSDEFIKRYSDPQPLNRYSYAKNNPLKYTDPSGLAEAKIIILVTSNTVDGDLEAWQNSSYGNNPDARIYPNVDSIQKAGEILAKGDIKAIQIFISGHGTEDGGTSPKLGVDYKNNFNAYGFGYKNNKEAVNAMKSGMDKDATLTHISCYAGKKRFDLQDTANILGIKVVGYTGVAFAGPNPTGNMEEKEPENNEEKKKMEKMTEKIPLVKQ